jgi:two-component system, OmpR family, sensor histidine kinase KdpD
VTGGRRSPAKSYLWAASVVAACTLVCAAMFHRFDDSNLIMVYLLGVALVASRHGRGPSALAACLSVALFDFFYVPPHFTFTVADTQYLVTFAVMLVVALLVSTLAVRAREQAAAAQQARLAVDQERLRNTLLSSVSHDFRTPLASITGAVTCLLQEKSLDAAAERDLKETIHEEAERLNRLVTNLLDMTRLESGSVELRRDWDSLEDVVGSALARLEGRLGRRPVETQIAADLPLVRIDASLIEQVLVNLLENAVKYTPQDSRIRIRAARANGEVVVTVANDGPRLPAGEEERIFEKFYRTSASADGGFGLGLPICRAIVTAHGGRIWAENLTPQGVAFQFTLAAQEQPPTPRAPDDSPAA